MSNSAVDMLYNTIPHVRPMIIAFVSLPADSRAFSLRHCSDPFTVTLFVKLMVEATIFRSQSWDLLGQPYVRSDQTKWRTDTTPSLQDPGLVFDTILKRRKVKKIGYCCYLTIAHASSCLI